MVSALHDLEAQARTERAAIAEIEARARTPVHLPSPAWVLERFGELGRLLEGDVAWGRELLGRLVEPSGIRLTPEEVPGEHVRRWRLRFGVMPLVLLQAETPPLGASQRRRAGPSIAGIAGACSDDFRRLVVWIEAAA